MAVQRRCGPQPQATPPATPQGAAARAARTSASPPGAALPLAARTGPVRTPAPPSASSQVHAAALPQRPRSTEPLRIRPADAVPRPAARDVAHFDRAAAAITSMLHEPKPHAGPADAPDSAHRAAIRARIARLQKMLGFREAALQTQAELRIRLAALDGRAEPARYASWAEAAALDLGAVFQESQDALRALRSVLDGSPSPLPARAADAISDAASDTDTEDFVDAPTELADASDSDADLGTEADAARPAKGAGSGRPPSARSLKAEGAVLDFRPNGAWSFQDNSAALKARLAQVEALHADRHRFGDADRDMIRQALRDLRNQMRELTEFLDEKGVPHALAFRDPAQRARAAAERERRLRDDQEALDGGHYTF